MNIFKYQLWHVSFLILTFYFLNVYLADDVDVLTGSLWGINTYNWLIFSLTVPVIHQIYVLICWRLELFYKGISKRFGPGGFKYYKVGFIILILLRPISILLLSISNAKTFQMNTILYVIVLTLLTIPAMYLLYSVVRFFGIDRAVGRDHFEPAKYKTNPLVKRGIFKYTSNGMYNFGFFLLWLPGIVFESKAALLSALFSHLYIWVHYFCTERPDMRYIYSDRT